MNNEFAIGIVWSMDFTRIVELEYIDPSLTGSVPFDVNDKYHHCQLITGRLTDEIIKLVHPDSKDCQRFIKEHIRHIREQQLNTLLQ